MIRGGSGANGDHGVSGRTRHAHNYFGVHILHLHGLSPIYIGTYCFLVSHSSGHYI